MVHFRSRSTKIATHTKEQIATGFPQAMEILQNLENHQKSAMHRKIMEFEKT